MDAADAWTGIAAKEEMGKKPPPFTPLPVATKRDGERKKKLSRLCMGLKERDSLRKMPASLEALVWGNESGQQKQ